MTLLQRIQESERVHNVAMKEAREVAEKAMKEFLQMKHEEKIRQRYARMFASRLQRTIKDLCHVPSLAVSSERDTTKDGGTWFSKSNGGNNYE